MHVLFRTLIMPTDPIHISNVYRERSIHQSIHCVIVEVKDKMRRQNLPFPLCTIKIVNCVCVCVMLWCTKQKSVVV